MDTQLNEPTKHNLCKAPKVIRITHEKRYYKTLGTSVINNLMSPLFLKLASREGAKLSLQFEEGWGHWTENLIIFQSFINTFPHSFAKNYRDFFLLNKQAV